jgi:hypothetical protein
MSMRECRISLESSGRLASPLNEEDRNLRVDAEF